MLYYFPVITVTNDYKLSGFRHKANLSLWKSGVQNESYKDKIKVLAELVASGGSLEESVPCLFQIRVVANQHFLALTASLPFLHP